MFTSREDAEIHAEMARLLDIRPLPPAADVLALYERWRVRSGLPYPEDATPLDTAWASFHKTRLWRIGSTRQDRRDSRRWLAEHGFTVEPPPGHDLPSVH